MHSPVQHRTRSASMLHVLRDMSSGTTQTLVHTVRIRSFVCCTPHYPAVLCTRPMLFLFTLFLCSCVHLHILPLHPRSICPEDLLFHGSCCGMSKRGRCTVYPVSTPTCSSLHWSQPVTLEVEGNPTVSRPSKSPAAHHAPKNCASVTGQSPIACRSSNAPSQPFSYHKASPLGAGESDAMGPTPKHCPRGASAVCAPSARPACTFLEASRPGWLEPRKGNERHTRPCK